MVLCMVNCYKASTNYVVYAEYNGTSWSSATYLYVAAFTCVLGTDNVSLFHDSDRIQCAVSAYCTGQEEVVSTTASGVSTLTTIPKRIRLANRLSDSYFNDCEFYFCFLSDKKLGKAEDATTTTGLDSWGCFPTTLSLVGPETPTPHPKYILFSLMRRNFVVGAIFNDEKSLAAGKPDNYMLACCTSYMPGMLEHEKCEN